MARVEIKGLTPPFARGRMHTFTADKRCALRDLEVTFNSTEPKAYAIVMQRRGERVKETGEFVQRDITGQKSVNMKTGDRVIFLLKDSPIGIEGVDITYSTGKAKKFSKE